MAFDSYMKIATIEGESTAKGHEKWVELTSYSHGISQHSGGSISAAGGLSGGRADHALFTITHKLDKSSPKLSLACSTGEHIKDISIDVCRATGEGKGTRFMNYALSDVIVSSIEIEGTTKGESDLPLETVRFSYGKIEWTYTEHDNTGKKKGEIKSGWDVSKGAKV